MPFDSIYFFFFYGVFNAYFFLKVRAVFAPRTAFQVILAFLLFLGLTTPLIVRAAVDFGLDAMAILFGWLGYTWMAILFYFSSAEMCLEPTRIVACQSCRLFKKEISAFLPSPRTLFFLPLGLALAVTGYGLYEARQIGTERLEIHSAMIPKTAGKIRIVQISDIHAGVLVRGERLASMLRVVREAQPDLIVSTGDIMDSQLHSLAETAAQLRELQPRYGKFAVTGNHEFYSGSFDDAVEFTREAGFTILRGEVATIAGAFALAGVDDPLFRARGAPWQLIGPGSLRRRKGAFHHPSQAPANGGRRRSRDLRTPALRPHPQRTGLALHPVHADLLSLSDGQLWPGKRSPAPRQPGDGNVGAAHPRSGEARSHRDRPDSGLTGTPERAAEI